MIAQQQPPPPPPALACLLALLHRFAASACLALVLVLDSLTAAHLSRSQGFCVGVLALLVAEATDSAAVRLKLFKRVCLLLVSQRVRSLFVVESTEAAAFTDLFLAVSVAMALVLCDKDDADLRSVLTTLTYLYGGILDFTLQAYGAFPVTVMALGVSVWTDVMPAPAVDRIHAFCWSLAKIISANLVCVGADMLIASEAVELEILECIATVAVLKHLLPSMESYLTFVAARKLVMLVPGCAALMFCGVVWAHWLNAAAWLGDLAFNYVVMDASRLLQNMSLPWTVFVVIMLHYADHVVASSLL
jgi:hypothetical protein